jgi:hypothetical protein
MEFNKTCTKVRKYYNGDSRFSSESPGRTSGVLTALKSFAACVCLILAACNAVSTPPQTDTVEAQKGGATEALLVSNRKTTPMPTGSPSFGSNGAKKILPAITRSVPVTTPSKAARSPTSPSGKVT